jgi:hypothetical protein
VTPEKIEENKEEKKLLIKKIKWKKSQNKVKI